MIDTPAECQRHRLTLSAAHDGGTGADGLLAAEAHLLGCGPCRAFRAGLRRLDDLVASAVLPPAPDVAARLAAVPEPLFDRRPPSPPDPLDAGRGGAGAGGAGPG